MSSRRARSLAAVLLVALLPATAQAQFGKLINKAKVLRSNVDSAKAVVATSRQTAARGASAENSYRASKPTDGAAAINAGVSASGSNKTDFEVVQSKVDMYASHANANKEPVLSRILPAGDMTVFNAHKSDILQLVNGKAQK